jgi:hypothetical protein
MLIAHMAPDLTYISRLHNARDQAGFVAEGAETNVFGEKSSKGFHKTVDSTWFQGLGMGSLHDADRNRTRVIRTGAKAKYLSASILATIQYICSSPN